jgi:hypothetical protein
MIGLAENLQSYITNNNEASHLVNIIKISAHFMLFLVNDQLDFF